MSSVYNLLQDPRLDGVPAEELDGRDMALLGALNRSLPRAEAAGVLRWWAGEREPDEPLADFLMSRQVLIKTAGGKLNRAAQAGDPLNLDKLFTVHGREYMSGEMADLGLIDTTPPPARGTSDTPTAGPATTPPAAAPRHEPEVGTMLGRCLLTERMGREPGSSVFRGLHRTLNIPVAVKVLSPGLFNRHPEVGQQFREEARRLSQLNHPHVVRVWDFDEQDGRPYLIQEFVEGLSLEELIQQSGRIQQDRAVRLLGHAAEGLAAAAEMGIVHRDMKPSNVLISREGVAKVVDFALGLLDGADSPAGGDDVTGRDGRPTDAVAYRPPEQTFPTRQFDPRSDMYSLGCTFYHALTGQPPFTGRTRMEVMLKHVREPVTPPAEWEPSLDRGLSSLVVRLMAKSPEDRFGDYAELRAAVDELEADLRRPDGRQADRVTRRPTATPGSSQANADRPVPPGRIPWKKLLDRFGDRAS